MNTMSEILTYDDMIVEHFIEISWKYDTFRTKYLQSIFKNDHRFTNMHRILEVIELISYINTYDV